MTLKTNTRVFIVRNYSVNIDSLMSAAVTWAAPVYCYFHCLGLSSVFLGAQQRSLVYFPHDPVFPLLSLSPLLTVCLYAGASPELSLMLDCFPPVAFPVSILS